MNSTPIVLNCDLIEQISMVPDTMIALTNGKTLLVQESVDQIVEKVIEFRRQTQSGRRFELDGRP